MKSLLMLTFAVFTLSIFGRAPAVEPIRGISIDNYREVNPKKDPGFNWSKDNTSLITTQAPTQKQLIEQTTSQKKNWPTYVFLASLITLPFILWYSVMKGLEGAEAIAQNNTSSPNLPYHDNTVDLMAERNKREEKKKKDIHKAS